MDIQKQKQISEAPRENTLSSSRRKILQMATAITLGVQVLLPVEINSHGIDFSQAQAAEILTGAKAISMFSGLSALAEETQETLGITLNISALKNKEAELKNALKNVPNASVYQKDLTHIEFVYQQFDELRVDLYKKYKNSQGTRSKSDIAEVTVRYEEAIEAIDDLLKKLSPQASAPAQTTTPEAPVQLADYKNLSKSAAAADALIDGKSSNINAATLQYWGNELTKLLQTELKTPSDHQKKLILRLGSIARNMEMLPTSGAEEFDKIKELFRLYKQTLGTYQELFAPYKTQNELPKIEGFKYTLQKGDTLAPLIERLFDLDGNPGKREAGVALLMKNGIDPRRIQAGKTIDLSPLFGPEFSKTQKEISPEVQEKYKKGVLAELLIKSPGNTFPMSVLYGEFIWNALEGKDLAFCAGSEFEEDSRNFLRKPPSYDPELLGQGNAYQTLEQEKANGAEDVDTGDPVVRLIKVSEESLSGYTPSRTTVKIKWPKNKANPFGGSVVPNKKGQTEIHFTREIRLKGGFDRAVKINGEWWKFTIDREKLAEKRTAMYEAAKNNTLGHIFWHFSFTNEWTKIAETFVKSGGNAEISDGSHVTTILGRGNIWFPQPMLKEKLKKGNVSLDDALNHTIPGWIDGEKEVDREKIFSQVKVRIKNGNNAVLEATLWDLFNAPEKTKYILKEGDIFEVEDILVRHEYNTGNGAEIRKDPLTAMLTRTDGGVFYPTEQVTFPAQNITGEAVVPNEFRQASIPDAVETFEKIDGVKLAGRDGPRIVPISKEPVSAAIIGTSSSLFSNANSEKIFDWYNKNVADGSENKPFYKPNEDKGRQTVFYYYNKHTKTFTFKRQELNFDQIFKRWVREGVYKKEDKARVKILLGQWGDAIGKNLLAEQVSSNMVFPIFAFEKEAKPNTFKEGKLKSFGEIKTAGKGIDRFDNLEQKHYEWAQAVTKDPYEQAVLLSIMGFESLSGNSLAYALTDGEISSKRGVKKMIAKTLNPILPTSETIRANIPAIIGNISIVDRALKERDRMNIRSGGLMQTNYEQAAHQFARFLTQDITDNDTEYTKQIKLSWKKSRFASDIEGNQKRIRDNDETLQNEVWFQKLRGYVRENIDKKDVFSILIGELAISLDKRPSITQYAQLYYGQDFFTQLDANMTSDLESLAIASYTGELNRHLVRGQIYVMKTLEFLANNGFDISKVSPDFIAQQLPKTDATTGVESRFNENHIRLAEKLILGTPQYQKILSDKGIVVTSESIRNTFVGEKNGNTVFSDDPKRILGGQLFKDSMKGKKAVNALQAIRIIFTELYKVPPPMFMGATFRKDFRYTDSDGKEHGDRGGNVMFDVQNRFLEKSKIDAMRKNTNNLAMGMSDSPYRWY